jgi:hypothetical protein
MARENFDLKDSKFRSPKSDGTVDRTPADIYYQEDVVGLSDSLPVLYVLLYVCVHWRPGAADLTIL